MFSRRPPPPPSKKPAPGAPAPPPIHPKPEDLIVPTRNLTIRQPTEAQEALIADLKLLGLRTEAGETRNRRGHDLRRHTFITLARTDGALDGPPRWVTHGPSASSMTELYSTFSWTTLCTESRS